MFQAKNSRGARTIRPGLMSTSRPDEHLKTLLMIVSGCSLVGLFALVMIRSQLLVAVSSLGDDLDTQKQAVSDLRRRLSDTNAKLSSERQRLEDLKMQRDEDHNESSHIQEALHEKLKNSQLLLDACHEEHHDELKIEVEECRADVTDLQKDLATVQKSLKKQQEQTLDWKEAYDAEFKTHAKLQSTMTDLRTQLRECKDASQAARAAAHAHAHPPAPPTGTDVPEPQVRRSAAGEGARETAGQPGETQPAKATVGSGPRPTGDTETGREYASGDVPRKAVSTEAEVRTAAVSDDPPRHVSFDDDLLDQPHYHHADDEDPAETEQGRAHHEDAFYEPHNHHARDSNIASQHYTDYELMHHHYRMHVGHPHEYDEAQPEYDSVTQEDVPAQPEHPGGQAEAGEVPAEDSLRIHHLRRRGPADAAVDPAEEVETLS